MKTETPTTEIRQLPLEQLVESVHNPRRRFDGPGLAELTESIRTSGVLVPLLVRPVNGHYEIVAGARRKRAAAAAGLSEVPVIVRELNDDQALEAAIVENLQRRDVHPLDEAFGYRALMDRAHYEAEAIAAKVGKSESYVYQRLQLLKLIEPLQKLFLEEELTAAHAVELARLTPADQQTLLKDGDDGLFEHAWEGRTRARLGPIAVRSLRHLIQRTCHLDLARATFDVADPDLVAQAGACTACPKRAGANPALFADIAKGDTCTDRACYEQKQQRGLERRQVTLAARGVKVVLISNDYGYSGNDEKRLKAAGILRLQEYGRARDDGAWKDAGNKKCEHLAKGLVAEGRELGVVKTVCTAPGTCKVHRVVFDHRTSTTRGSAAMKKQLREQRIRGQARRRTLDAILAKVTWPLAVEDVRALVLHDFKRLYNPFDKEIVRAMGWVPEGKKAGALDQDRLFREHLAKFSDDDLARMIVRVLLWPDTNSGPAWHGGAESTSLKAFAQRYRVDAARVERDVRAEMLAKEKTCATKPSKKTVQTSARAAKRDSSPTVTDRGVPGVCRVCGCTEDEPCEGPEGACYWADPSETLCSACAANEPAPTTKKKTPKKPAAKPKPKAKKTARAKK